MKLYVLYDSAVQQGQHGVMVLHTDEEARRIALRAACDQKSMIYQSPDDYVLYRVGEFDPTTCEVAGTGLHVVVSSAEFLSAVRQFQRTQSHLDEE